MAVTIMESAWVSLRKIPLSPEALNALFSCTWRRGCLLPKAFVFAPIIVPTHKSVSVWKPNVRGVVMSFTLLMKDVTTPCVILQSSWFKRAPSCTVWKLWSGSVMMFWEVFSGVVGVETLMRGLHPIAAPFWFKPDFSITIHMVVQTYELLVANSSYFKF